ncbi:MAG: CYTH domain-containing protein [Bacilli bacterium]|nr:CYTH domain-containing protein [Bacilli bacterium]
MSTNIEIESKVLLTEADFKKVYNLLKAEQYKKIEQINYYIDDELQTLRSFGFSLRVREKDGFDFTLKTPLSEGLLERSQIISKEEFDDFASKGIFPTGDVKNFLEILGINASTLKIITTLKTERINIEKPNGLLSLDVSTYNGLIDYELEMEATSLEEAQKELMALCEQAGCEYKQNLLSKQARAFNSITK